jgi:hypothetical protein
MKALIVTVALGMGATARAQDQDPAQQDWARFHIGFAVGESHWSRSLSEASETLAQFWGDKSVGDSTGRKLVAGFRPVRVVGAEIQYIDFGEAEISDREFQGGGQVTFTRAGLQARASASAWVVSAVLFIPERAPAIDVYGKVGIAELDESLEAHHFNYNLGTPLGGCVPFSSCPLTVEDSEARQSDSRPYFGIGALFKVARSLGIRVEYEAIDRETGDDTTMFSIGVAFER